MKLNKKGNAAVTVILVIIILGLVGFILYDKVLSNNKNIENVAEEPITNVINEKTLTQVVYSYEDINQERKSVNIVDKEILDKILDVYTNAKDGGITTTGVGIDNTLALTFNNGETLNLSLDGSSFVSTNSDHIYIFKDGFNLVDYLKSKVNNVSSVQILNTQIKDKMSGTELGNITIDKIGQVFYEPSIIKIINPEVLGTKGSYKIDGLLDMDGNQMTLDGYKLDLNNIKSADSIYFGNGKSKQSVIFISNDGKISELVFSIEDSSVKVKLFKNIKNYNNIVNVREKSSDDGQSAILTDKNGKEISYSGAEQEA